MSFEYPNNFYEAMDLFVHFNGKLKKLSDGHKRSVSRKVSHNTQMMVTFSDYDDTKIQCAYHGADVVTWNSDGTAELDHHGYRNATTKRRMNQCGFNVYQSKHEWYVTTQAGTFAWGDDSRIMIDEDGMVHWKSGQAHCVKSA